MCKNVHQMKLFMDKKGEEVGKIVIFKAESFYKLIQKLCGIFCFFS